MKREDQQDAQSQEPKNPAHNTHPEAKKIRSIQIKLKERDANVTRADNQIVAFDS